MSRKEKRAAKAEVKTEFKRAAKTSKAELLENMLLEAARREMKVKTQTLPDLLLSDDDCLSE